MKKDSKEVDDFSKKRKKIVDQLDQADRTMKTIQEKIQEFKSKRKTSGDGIETEMFAHL